MHCEGKLKLRSRNYISYCLIDLVTTAGLTVVYKESIYSCLGKILNAPSTHKICFSITEIEDNFIIIFHTLSPNE